VIESLKLLHNSK